MNVLMPRAILTNVRQNQKNPKKLFITIADNEGVVDLETEQLDYAQALQAKLIPVSVEMTVRAYVYDGKQRLDAIQISIKALKAS